MYITLCDIYISTKVALLTTDVQKETFVQGISAVLSNTYLASVLLVWSFLGAFVVMGYIKLWSYSMTDEKTQSGFSNQYGWLQCVGGLAALVAIGTQVNSIKRAALQSRRIMLSGDLDASLNHTESVVSLVADELDWKTRQKELGIRADAMTFQTGNVFYEILFSAINFQDIGANYMYFGFSVLTLMIGTVGLSVSTLLSYWGDSMPNEYQGRWARRSKVYQRFLERSYVASLYAWMFAMFFSTSVKYPDLRLSTGVFVLGREVALPASTGWSLFGIAVITYYVFRIPHIVRIVTASEDDASAVEMPLSYRRQWEESQANAPGEDDLGRGERKEELSGDW